MYQINVSIKGITPLLQHKFGAASMEALQASASKRSGTPDYSLEWLDTLYSTPEGYLCQPSSHIEGALVKSAAMFKMKGKGGKTWKDNFKAFVYVNPADIIHHWQGQPISAPDASLLTTPQDCMSVSVMRVVVQRSAVARARLMVHAGWELPFVIEVHDEQTRLDVVQEVLAKAGQSVGIGDFRPRYGRFEVTRFETV